MRKALLLLLVLAAPATATDLVPRAEMAPEALFVVPDHEQRLVVKFVDDARVRPTASGDVSSRTGVDLGPVKAVAGAMGLSFEPLIRLPESKLSSLEARAATTSGRAQPDLAGMMIVELPGATKEQLRELGEALQAMDLIEWAYLETLGVPPPVDIPPASGDLTGSQVYRTGNPGLNSDYAWTYGPGTTGVGVRISDCEYGWTNTHEDLNEIDLNLEPGQTIHPEVYIEYWERHGTAVAGISVGLINEYGVHGMAPGSEFYTYPEYTVEQGFRRVTAVTNAIANSAPGDVVLLEMQTYGAGGDYGPAELALGVWTATKTGTDAGVIVVAAAGNGNQNLDDSAYAPYMNRGDSGALMIGAGSSFVSHYKLSFSTYGSRVNVQAWGEDVTTLAYGNVAYNGDDEEQWYTLSFNGTSSASALAAPSCALIQSFNLQATGTLLTPLELRAMLIDTGWAQGSGGHIGPAINIKKCLRIYYPNVASPEIGPAAAHSLRIAPNPFAESTVIRFDALGSSRVEVSIFDVAGRRIRTLASESTAAGPRAVSWDGRTDAGTRVHSGVYFVRLGDDRETGGKRVVLLD